MKTSNWFFCLLLLGSATVIVGCGDDESESVADDDGNTPDGPGFGGPADVEIGAQLWRDIANYRDWSPPTGFEGFVESAAPHGEFVRFFLNDAAVADSTLAADGSIIVKENFDSDSEDALGAVTVMYKRVGYAPEHGDWFWAKFSPDGSIDQNPDGVPLAGRVGVSGPGCISCHASAEGGDYVHIN